MDDYEIFFYQLRLMYSTLNCMWTFCTDFEVPDVHFAPQGYLLLLSEADDEALETDNDTQRYFGCLKDTSFITLCHCVHEVWLGLNLQPR
jgi:hypothetical protein